MKAKFAAAIDRPTGKATVTIDPFIPENMIMAPTGATHFQNRHCGRGHRF